MRDYRKLVTFQRAHELVLAVYRETRKFPREETYGITSQLRRAAVSITSNIVEGSCRDSKREYVRFLNIALSSAVEVEYQLELSVDLNLGTNYTTFGLGPQEAARDIDREKVIALAKETVRLLVGLLRGLEPGAWNLESS